MNGHKSQEWVRAIKHEWPLHLTPEGLTHHVLVVPRMKWAIMYHAVSCHLQQD